MATAKWTVWSLDVWGNDEDGYEVNDRSRCGEIEFDADTAKDQDINDALVAGGFICACNALNIDGDDGMLFVDTADGKPLYQLTREE